MKKLLELTWDLQDPKLRLEIFDHQVNFAGDIKPEYECWSYKGKNFLTLVLNGEILTFRISYETTETDNDTIVIDTMYFHGWKVLVKESNLGKLGFNSYTDFIKSIKAKLNNHNSNAGSLSSIRHMVLKRRFSASTELYTDIAMEA